MKSNEEVQEFVEGLYDDMDEQLNDTYRQQKESRDKLLQEIAMVILTCTVADSILKLSNNDYKQKDKLLGGLIVSLVKDDIKQQTSNTEKILTNTVKNTFGFYSYNAGLKDAKNIVNQNFKGKHFSSRVWDNEQQVANKLTKQCQDFLKGKVTVNQIEKSIKDTYNASAYNAKRLVETEVSRCHAGAFNRFCKETGVKKLKYNAVLDRKTCSDCKEYDGKIYLFGKHPELPRHPLCRCYYDIIE